MAAPKLSPMMRQYMEIKEEYRDCILFFRLGDFYEMFFDDATLASRELELTLTGKNCGMEERAPMCGVPFHSADTYIARLVEKGYKVAICEQTEDPAASKGIVKREVIQIVTPGTVLSSSMLRENENNYIASVFAGDDTLGLSYCDVSTGEIYLTSISGSGMKENLVNELVSRGLLHVSKETTPAGVGRPDGDGEPRQHRRQGAGLGRGAVRHPVAQPGPGQRAQQGLLVVVAALGFFRAVLGAFFLFKSLIVVDKGVRHKKGDQPYGKDKRRREGACRNQSSGILKRCRIPSGKDCGRTKSGDHSAGSVGKCGDSGK